MFPTFPQLLPVPTLQLPELKLKTGSAELIRKGLVTRTRSVNSNREVAVKLSAKGQSLVSHLIPIALDFEAAAIAGLSSKDIAVLKRCLRRMYGNMKTRAAAVDRRNARRDPGRGKG